MILTLLHELQKKDQTPNALAIDISKKALQVAKHNAKKLQTKNITFIKSNLLTLILKKPKLLKDSKQLIILANLPYLTKKEINKEKSISREPRQALDGGKDGLHLYRELSIQLISLQKIKPFEVTLLCEINPHQRTGIHKIWKKNILFKKDFSNKIRVGVVKIIYEAIGRN